MEQTKENKVLDIIITLAKAIKATENPDKDKCQYYLDDGTNLLWGEKYLLGQILRQYRINNDHIFISVEADKLWKEITDKEIKDYHYTMQVPISQECTLALYKGAAKNPFVEVSLKPNDTFQYRQVFHDEHVIPIADIIKNLIKLDDLNYDSAQKILNNIYMCRMLKKENIALNNGNRNKREWNVVETIEKIYKETHGIEIVSWEEIKKNLQIQNLV